MHGKAFEVSELAKISLKAWTAAKQVLIVECGEDEAKVEACLVIIYESLKKGLSEGNVAWEAIEG